MSENNRESEVSHQFDTAQSLIDFINASVPKEWGTLSSDPYILESYKRRSEMKLPFLIKKTREGTDGGTLWIEYEIDFGADEIYTLTFCGDYSEQYGVDWDYGDQYLTYNRG